MFETRSCLALAVAIFSLVPCPAAGPPPHRPSAQDVARWIRELGEDDFTQREHATQKLRLAGEIAEPALLQALDSKDAEVVLRARAILADFKWGIYPQTPPAIVRLISSYRSAARSEKREAIRKLLAAGAPGCRALVKIARAEEDPLVRKEVFADLTAGLGRGGPQLLEEGNRAALESLLEVALAGDTRIGILHYAAYHQLSGQLPARIAEWEGRAKAAVVPKTENEVLTYLHRAGGNFPRARQTALEAERIDLLEALLYEQPDWKELARRPQLPMTEDVVRYIGYRAAYSRLAEAKKPYDDAIGDLRKKASEIVGAGGQTLPYAKALFLNAQPDAAIETLRKGDHNAKALYEVLASQTRIADAFEVVDAARKSSSAALPLLEIAQARTLHFLGDKDRSLAILDKYTREMRKGVEVSWPLDLVETELAIGRRDAAFAVAGKILTNSTDSTWPGRLLDKLFEDHEEEARKLWTLLRGLKPAEEAAAALDRVRLFLDGKATAQQLDDLIEAATAKPANPRATWRLLGELCVFAKQTKKATECFQKAASPRGLLRLGDLLAQNKDWNGAAERYLAAYRQALNAEPAKADEENTITAPLALYLTGHAAKQAGRTAEARERIDRAHLLPLGDAEMRYDLVREYRRRGLREAERREQECLRRFGEPLLAEPNSYYTGEGLRGAGIEAAARKEWLKAADGYEQTFLRTMQPGMNFARAAAYVTVPAHISMLRARGLVAAGRLDEAVVEAERARASQPGSIDLAMHLVPELGRVGRRKAAESLYRGVLQRHEAVIRDYPRCAWALNQAAWLAACCRRDLEQALKYSQRAVELSPKTPAYYDTLAEVFFQMGKKEEAIAAQKKAIALHPTREYFKKQLKRIESGDPRSPRPEEEE